MHETLTKSGLINSLETHKQTSFLKAFQNEIVSYDNREKVRHQSLASAKRGSDMETTLRNETDLVGNDDGPQPRSGESYRRGLDAQHSSQKKFDIKIIKVANDQPVEGQGLSQS